MKDAAATVVMLEYSTLLSRLDCIAEDTTLIDDKQLYSVWKKKNT